MNKFNPLVSIVIPVFNGENYLKEAIDSALGQTYKNLEIIVINDGSTDKTEEIALSYHDKIRYFKKENGGVATALNFGIEKMNGEYFSWLSHDDLYNKNKINSQIRVLSNLNNKEVVIGCYHLIINNERKILKRIQTFNNRYEYNKQNALIYLFRGYIQGCDLLISKKIFFQYGNFNPELATTQDYDMWFRIFKNEKLYIVPEYLVYYRTHKQQSSLIKENEHLSECNELWIGFDQKLTAEEKKDFFGSEDNFYRELLKNLSLMALYSEAILYYKTKINGNIYNDSKYSMKQQNSNFFFLMRAIYLKYGIYILLKKIISKAQFSLLNIVQKKV